MNKHCKHCKESLPPFTLQFSNEAAVALGYCSWFCLLSALGEEKALRAVQKYREKTHERPQERRSQGGSSNRINKQNQDVAIQGNKRKKSVLELILSDDQEEAKV